MMLAKTNEGQRAAFNEIMASIEDVNSLHPFFLDGPGGTGKTFLYNTTTKLNYALDRINHLFKMVAKNRNQPFGNKVFLLGGDFRQCLPVLRNGDRVQVETIKKQRNLASLPTTAIGAEHAGAKTFTSRKRPSLDGLLFLVCQYNMSTCVTICGQCECRGRWEADPVGASAYLRERAATVRTDGDGEIGKCVSRSNFCYF
jgi:hypothetical protein